MNTLGDLFNKSCAYLEAKGIEDAKRATEHLFMRGLSLDRLDLYLNFEKPLSEDEVSDLRVRLQKRAEGVPDAYIDGKVEFLGCEIHVTKDVLIPRPETELLAEKVIAQAKKLNIPDLTLWDVCTGSGALAIALKKHLPKATVYASDISQRALQVAQKNAQINETQITFLEGDLFEPFQKQKAHVIVSNPPYIGLNESIGSEVKDHEPAIALYGGKDGLDFYRKIAQKAPGHLYPQGRLWLEMGYTQSEEVKEIFSQNPADTPSLWESMQTLKDYSGWSRYFYLERGAQTVYD